MVNFAYKGKPPAAHAGSFVHDSNPADESEAASVKAKLLAAPDTPCSLFEGVAGLVCLYAALLENPCVPSQRILPIHAIFTGIDCFRCAEEGTSPPLRMRLH